MGDALGEPGPGPAVGPLVGWGTSGSPATTTAWGLGALAGSDGAAEGVGEPAVGTRGERKGRAEPSGPLATCTARTATAPAAAMAPEPRAAPRHRLGLTRSGS